MKIALAVVAVLACGSAAAIFAGMARWNTATAATVALLAPGQARVSSAELAALPPAAARYFARALSDAHRQVRFATATQRAKFFINGAWRDLRATQHFAASPPGFVWDARIEMAPLLPASVRDAYVGGRGSLQASMFGLYSLVDQSGVAELNAGALQRFLGEAVWFPTALLPSAGVRWSARDDLSAAATLTDHAVSVSLLFQFNGDGDVIRISGDRYKESNGTYTLQPWVITCGDHAERGGMRIPLFCEVAWVGSKGPEPYWRGRVTDITYTFAQ